MRHKLTFRHLAIFLLILWVIPAYAQLPQAPLNFCQAGGQQVNIQGLLSSTRVQASYPLCTVTVRNAGTATISTIFSTSGGGALGNPFTANSDGSFLFFASNTVCYDVTISGGTPNALPAPFTYSNICLAGSGGGGGGGGTPAGGIGDVQTNAGGGNFGAITSVAKGSALVSNSTGTAPAYQSKAIYDTRDWMTCDTPRGSSTGTDASAGLSAMLTAIGSQNATIRWIGSTNPSDTCKVGNFFAGANISHDFSGGGAFTLISSSTAIGGGSWVSGTSVECGAGTTCSLPPFSITTGNTIVVAEAPYPGFSPNKTTRITDTCGNFYIHVFQSLFNQTRNQGAWIASSATGGTCTITATANASLTTHMMLVAQVAGMGPVTSLDTSASNNNTGLTMSSGSATTLTGAFLFAFGGQPFTFPETCTAGAGYTQPAGIAGQSSPNGSLCAQYRNSSLGGSTSASQTISSNPSPGLWVYSLISLKPGNATATIWGGIIDPDQHQICYNCDSQTGHGVVDFTGSPITQDVYPEWWGASSNATAAINTPAIQASIWAAFGGGLTQPRTNSSGLSLYNRPLRLGSQYQINDELKFYNVNGFKVYGVNRLSSGIQQTATNKRILDCQSCSYGSFSDLTFSTQSTQNAALVDLDWNGVTTPGDLKPQFIDLDRVGFNGSNVGFIGLEIAKSGGSAQGSNIYCRDCNFLGFTEACAQIGTAAAFATNALAIGFSGDMQGCPKYGIVSYGGGYISFGDGVEESSMENGFSTQTGFDMICVGSQGPCSMDYMRSESRRLISGNDIVLHKSRMINQASYLPPGQTFPVNSLMTGSVVGGDGAFYKVTSNAGAAGGIGTITSPLRASSGTGTTLVDTNQTIAGSVTIKTFGTVSNELVTQAVTGATGTVLTAPTSNATVSGTLTSGSFVSGDTAQQAVTGVTCTVGAANTSILFNCTNFSGTADGTHVWTDLTTAGTFTPSGVPVFAVSNPPMLITAAAGAPDNSHDWVGATNGGHYTPTAVPVNQANFTVNAFTGFLVSVLTGKNAGCYGTVTSNTATDITFTAGWTTRYAKLGCPFPDTSSSFVVEPGWNHGTVTSGGMTMQYLDENAIDCQNPIGTSNCTATGRMEDVVIAGGKLRINPTMRIDNLLVARQDWFDSTGGQSPQGCCEMVNDWDGIRVAGTVAPNVVPYQGLFYQNWNMPSLTGVSYNGAVQERLGTKALVWDFGNVGTNNPPGGGLSGNSVWIGGRTDNGAGATASRNILEVGGFVGRGAPLPSAANNFNTTDQAGTDMDITGGPSTGTGTGGAINFWTSNPGASSLNPNSGLKRWQVSGVGHWLAGLDNTYDIGAAGATRPRRIYVGTDLVGPIGATTPNTAIFTTLTVGSGTAVSLIKFATDTPGAITVNAGTCTDRGVAIAGSSTTATIQISAAYALDANILVSPAQSVAGTAHYRICNPTGANITLNAAAAFNLSVIQ